jgi:hypothetical protein
VDLPQLSRILVEFPNISSEPDVKESGKEMMGSSEMDIFNKANDMMKAITK